MLMNKLQASSSEINGYIEPAAPVSMVPGQRSAANTDSIIDSDMQARSRRRQRRAVLSNVSGWTVRTW